MHRKSKLTTMPSSPIDRFPLSDSSTNNSFNCTADIPNNYDEESESEMKKYARYRFNQGHALLRKQLQRPIILQAQKTSGRRRFTFSGHQEHKVVYKKRRRFTSIVPPTKFLLGGNITDPLNLRSLQDEKVNQQLNAFSPASSPMPTRRNQVQLIIPPNINDPLNLNTGEDIELNLLTSKPRKRRRHRKGRREDENSEDVNQISPTDEVSPFDIAQESQIIVFSLDDCVEKESRDPSVQPESSNDEAVSNKIVSPVVPQGSPVKVTKKAFSRSVSRDVEDKPSVQKQFSKQKSLKAGVRKNIDSVKYRSNAQKFCYGNHVTNLSNWNYGESYDDDHRLRFLDESLFCGKDVLDIGCNTGQLAIYIAMHWQPRKVVGIDIDKKLVTRAQRKVRLQVSKNIVTETEIDFPASMAYMYGPLSKLARSSTKTLNEFPNNISLFEPAINNTYRSLEMRPDSFCEYLMSNEVGFSSCQTIGRTFHCTKAYRQDIFLLTKGYQSHQVRSFSQLKHELKKCETFYIDTEEANNNSLSTTDRDKSEDGYFSMDVNENNLKHSRDSGLVQAGSLPNLSEKVKDDLISQETTTQVLETVHSSPIMTKTTSPPPKKPTRTSKAPVNRDRKRTSQTKNGKKVQDTTQTKVSINSPPNKRLEIAWVHGYHGLDPARNLYILSTGELVYYVGAIAVIHHYTNGTQRHYLGHTEDILCMALHTHDDVLATGQGAGIDNKSQAHIRVWKADDLTTLAVIGQGKLESDIVGAVFSWEGSTMMILEGLQDTVVSLWDWQNDTEVTRVTTGQSLLGGAFHPLEEEIIVTYGRQHLAFWLKDGNGTLNRKDPLSAGRSGTNFLSMEFLSDGRLVTGNSRGFITVWALSEDSGKVFFIQKEFKAHDGEVTALLPLPEGVLISGSSANDQEGEIRVWDTTKKFVGLASAVLPTGSGGVTSLCPQKTVTNEWEVFVGTNKNVILEGSVMWALNPVVHGHCDDVRAVACHPDKPSFVTAGLDRYICKWEVNSLIWKVQSDSECFSVTIHPHGSIVAVGDEHGDVTFLNMEDGLHVTTLPVTNSPLYTLKYSPDGDTLAVGCADGNIYLFQTHSNGYMYKIDFVLPGSVPILMLDWSVDGGHLQAVFTDSEYHDIAFWDLKRKEKLHSATQLKELDWFNPNCTLGYKINGMWNNKHIPDAVHICCHVSHSKQYLAAGDKNGYIRLFRYPSTSDKAAYYEEKQCSTDVNVIQFLHDDSYLVSTGGPDGAIFVWKLSAAAVA